MKMFLTIIITFVISTLVYIFLVHPVIENYGSKTSPLTGTLDINGVIPTDAIVTLSYKSTTQESFETLQVQTPSDTSAWDIPKAQNGISYEIKGTISSNGTVIAHSNPIFVTAPASSQVLIFNIKSDNFSDPAAIAGSIGLNGYIPTGATVTIKARSGSDAFAPILTGLSAVDAEVFAYTKATAGQTYDVQAFLISAGGAEIGSSDILSVTAPAQNEVLNINSTAVSTAPTQPATSSISGTIQFNGSALTNSRVVVLARVSGTSEYSVAVDNISPQTGTSWSWNDAKPATWYDLIAVLKQRQSDGTDKDISDSQMITVAAPASGESFTLNSGFSLSAPTGAITAACGNKSQNGTVSQVTVSFASVTSAQSYWFQIGTTPGGIDLTNFTQNATANPTQSSTYSIKTGTVYYARYAYANVGNLLANDPQFSPLSNSSSFTCN